MAFTDEDVKVGVIGQLYWDGRVDASRVTVDVRDGIVTLAGTVPSYGAREAAYDDALTVPGVLSVRNDMVVEHPETGAPPLDDEIRRQVENILDWNPGLEGCRFQVSVEAGTATLEGSVDSYWKKVHAEEQISNIRGVTAIKNKISVVPTKKVGDENIARDIRAALERNVMVKAEKVGVKVENGVVTLSGRVPHWGARTAAFFAALYTNGVVHVDDRLTVEQM